MPISSQSSVLMLLSKLAPQSLRIMAGAPEIRDITLPQKLSNSFHSLVRGHVSHNMFHNVVTITQTKTFTMFGGWSNSIIVSILVKSVIGHIGALAWVLSCWMHHLQLPIAFCIWVAIPGHQNQSCNKHSVHCWPWCPASWWHPFMAATWWAWGLWIAEPLPIHQWVCGDGKGFLHRVLASSTLRE